MSKAKGERTPLLQQLPPMPTILNDEEAGDDSVCDNHPQRRRQLAKRSSVLLLIVAILSFITVYSIRIYSNMEAVINESAEITVKDIEFDGISTEDKSINLILDVDSSLNFSNTDFDVVTQKYLIYNSYLINNLNVDLENINITIGTGKEWIDTVGVVNMEPFNLKIYQGVTDHLKLRVNVKPNSASIFKTLKDIIISKSIIEMSGDFLLKIKVGYLRVPIKNMKLNFENVKIDPSALINELYDHHARLEKVSVSSTKIETAVSVQSLHESPILSRYINYIPSVPDFVYADVFMDGCNDTFKLSELKVSGLSGFVDHPTNNDVKLLTANSLPSTLFERCSETEISPLSTLIQSILYNEIVSNFTIKSSSKNKKILPVWLDHDLLDMISIAYHIPTLSSFATKGTGSIIQNVSISNLDLNIDNGIDRPQLRSGDIRFDLAIPAEISSADLGISNLRGLVNLMYEGYEFGYMNVSDWLTCKTQSLNTVCKLHQNDITVTDGSVYGALIADYLMGEDIKIQVKFVVDVLVDWELVHGDLFEISGLKGSGSGGL